MALKSKLFCKSKKKIKNITNFLILNMPNIYLNLYSYQNSHIIYSDYYFILFQNMEYNLFNNVG